MGEKFVLEDAPQLIHQCPFTPTNRPQRQREGREEGIDLHVGEFLSSKSTCFGDLFLVEIPEFSFS